MRSSYVRGCLLVAGIGTVSLGWAQSTIDWNRSTQSKPITETAAPGVGTTTLQRNNVPIAAQRAPSAAGYTPNVVPVEHLYGTVTVPPARQLVLALQGIACSDMTIFGGDQTTSVELQVQLTGNYSSGTCSFTISFGIDASKLVITPDTLSLMLRATPRAPNSQRPSCNGQDLLVKGPNNVDGDLPWFLIPTDNGKHVQYTIHDIACR